MELSLIVIRTHPVRLRLLLHTHPADRDNPDLSRSWAHPRILLYGVRFSFRLHFLRDILLWLLWHDPPPGPHPSQRPGAPVSVLPDQVLPLGTRRVQIVSHCCSFPLRVLVTHIPSQNTEHRSRRARSNSSAYTRDVISLTPARCTSPANQEPQRAKTRTRLPIQTPARFVTIAPSPSMQSAHV